MLQLLHPAALWTLAALALPLAIHLRRPPPRTVRLGSLRFLENVPRRPLRHPRWRELFLLCTRLGLLAVLSLLLAGTRWIVPPPAGARRWALLDPTAALTGESLAHWRDAQRAGYELRRLANGFPPVSNEPSSPADDGNVAAPDLWSLLREADAGLPAGSTLTVFSPGRLAALRGTRPALGRCKIEWFATPDATGNVPHEWVASNIGERLLAGRSDARSTVFAGKPAGNSATGRPMPPATSILILHDAEHAADAVYVEAAARAAADAVGRPVNLQNRDITPDVDNAAATDWTFWLSTRPVPDGMAARAPRIVCYTAGDPVTGADWIVAPSGDPANGARLWKRLTNPSTGRDGTVLWRDGQGNPVLTYSREAAGERWEVRTRFDPGWTDLPRTTALAAWMRALLFSAADAGPIHDRRLADPAQSRPSDRTVEAVPALALLDQPTKDLHWPLWMLAASLFALERVLSLRRSAGPSLTSARQPELATASR